MTTFTEFVINFFKYFGVFYIFSIILVACITYIIARLILSSINLGDNSSKLSNSLALLISISIAILAMYVPNIVTLLQYFLALFSIFLIILFFIFMLTSFVFGGKKVPTGDYAIASTILIIVFLIIFAFISLFYAYQNFFVKVNVGKSSSNGIDLFGLVWRPEILLIVFIFVILGFSAWIIGKEQGTTNNNR